MFQFNSTLTNTVLIGSFSLLYFLFFLLEIIYFASYSSLIVSRASAKCIYHNIYYVMFVSYNLRTWAVYKLSVQWLMFYCHFFTQQFVLHSFDHNRSFLAFGTTSRLE